MCRGDEQLVHVRLTLSVVEAPDVLRVKRVVVGYPGVVAGVVRVVSQGHRRGSTEHVPHALDVIDVAGVGESDQRAPTEVLDEVVARRATVGLERRRQWGDRGAPLLGTADVTQ